MFDEPYFKSITFEEIVDTINFYFFKCSKLSEYALFDKVVGSSLPTALLNLKYIYKLSLKNLPNYIRKLKAIRREIFKVNKCQTTSHSIYSAKANKVRVVPNGCGSLFCNTCQQKRQNDIKAKWYPDLLKKKEENNNELISLGLTLANINIDEGKEAVEFIGESLKRLFNLNIGKKLKKQAIEELMSSDMSAKQKELQLRYINDFFKVKNQKFKERFAGIFSLEFTHSEKEGLHLHYHCIINSKIPKTVINSLWFNATQGRSNITYIKLIRSNKEFDYLFKYQFKTTESNLSLEDKVKLSYYFMSKHRLRYLHLKPKKIISDYKVIIKNKRAVGNNDFDYSVIGNKVKHSDVNTAIDNIYKVKDSVAYKGTGKIIDDDFFNLEYEVNYKIAKVTKKKVNYRFISSKYKYTDFSKLQIYKYLERSGMLTTDEKLLERGIDFSDKAGYFKPTTSIENEYKASLIGKQNKVDLKFGYQFDYYVPNFDWLELEKSFIHLGDYRYNHYSSNRASLELLLNDTT